jgi:uncharacterized OB-fold protein
MPIPDPESAPYWEAAAEHRLVVQRCDACGHHYLYPRSACPRCWSTGNTWIDASGRGSVYSSTVIHRNDLPAFRDRVPYVVAIVELEEGPRLMTNVEGCEPEDVRCGMPVVVSFRTDADDAGATAVVPVFVPA